MALGTINIAKEFATLLDEGLGGYCLVRRPYRDSRDRVQKCRCTINGKDPSSDCRNCQGSGLIHVEIPVLLYSTYFYNLKDDAPLRVGPVNQTAKIFFAKGVQPITKSDLIVVVRLDPTTAKIIVPIVRLQYYDVGSVETYSAAKGVPEFQKIYSNEITIGERQKPSRQ